MKVVYAIADYIQVHRQVWWIIGKVVLAVALFWTIYAQIVNSFSATAKWDFMFIHFLSCEHIDYLLLASVLVGVNWLLEALKWQQLHYEQSLSLRQCFSTVLRGLAAGMVTPANLGDYAGRVANLDRSQIPKGLMATFISSLAQNIANISLGILAAYYFSTKYIDIVGMYVKSATILLLSVLVIVVALYYRSSILWAYTKKIPVLQRFFTISLNPYTFTVLNKVLAISLFRYVLYGVQYYLVLRYCGLDLGLGVMLSGIGVVYLIQSGIPLPPFLCFLARGEVAILIWGIFTQEIIAILAATTLLWLINKVLPSIIGLLLIFRLGAGKRSAAIEIIQG